jgi:hypothetical protein
MPGTKPLAKSAENEKPYFTFQDLTPELTPEP